MLRKLWGAFRSPRRGGAAPEDPHSHDPTPGPSPRAPNEERAGPRACRRRGPYPLLALSVLAVLALAGLLLYGKADVVTLAVQKGFDRVAQGSGPEAGENGGGPPLPLCARERGELSVLRSPTGETAAATDHYGNFTLYGAPGGDGLPTKESYELLRDCAPGLAPLNYAAIESRDGPRLIREGRTQGPREERSSVSQTFTFDGGLSVEQELRFRGEDLYVSYTARNSAEEPAELSIRSTLTPPAAAGGEPAFEVPSLSGIPLQKGGGAEIEVERNLLAERVAPFRVPRRGVPTDSSGAWGPGPSTPPDRIAFAGTLELTREPFLYDIRMGWPLPEAVSFAVYWQNLEVTPGESVTVTHHYGPER